MSLLPTRLALAVAAALISLLGVAATASADLRIPTLGEATTLSTLPESVSWGSATSSDGNATFVAFSESEAGIMFQRIGAAGTEFSSLDTLQSPGTASIGAPRVAVSGDTVHVAWIQESFFTREDHVAIATSRNGGRSFSPPVIAEQADRPRRLGPRARRRRRQRLRRLERRPRPAVDRGQPRRRPHVRLPGRHHGARLADRGRRLRHRRRRPARALGLARQRLRRLHAPLRATPAARSSRSSTCAPAARRTSSARRTSTPTAASSRSRRARSTGCRARTTRARTSATSPS